jgi:hypothetical protein
VDTSAPSLAVTPDEQAAAEGSVRAAVRAEDNVDVTWRLLDPAGDVVGSGEVETSDGRGAITADVDAGTYRLVVAATDSFDRTTTVRTTSHVADDPWPGWLVALLRGLLTLATVLALAGLALLARWAARPGSPVRSALAAGGSAVKSRLRVLVGPVPEADAAATVAALFEEEAEGRRIPFPRLPSRSGGAPAAAGDVVHRTPVRVYETAEERDDGPVLGSRTAELVVTRDRIALVDDRSGDIWSGRIAELAHVRDDTTVVLPVGERGWVGLVYPDPQVTRPALDLVATAPGSERRLTPAGTTVEGR